MKLSQMVLAASSLALVTMLGATSPAVGAADSKYDGVENWARLPAGMQWDAVAGVATDAAGNVYAYRRAEPPIVEVDRKGTFVRTFGEKMFAKAHGIRFDDRGFMWVTDQGPDHVVCKLDSEGRVLLTLGKKGVGGDGPDAFNGPTDVLVAPNGNIFVTDGEFNHRVVKFSADGKFIREWGMKGSGPGQFLVPHAIAMDSKGRVFVADRDNNRIQIFDQEGRFLEQWTQFGSPSGIFITKDDTLYALSASGRKGITVASAADGKVNDFIETRQNGLHLVAADPNGTIYVAGLGGGAGVLKFIRK